MEENTYELCRYIIHNMQDDSFNSEQWNTHHSKSINMFSKMLFQNDFKSRKKLFSKTLILFEIMTVYC